MVERLEGLWGHGGGIWTTSLTILANLFLTDRCKAVLKLGWIQDGTPESWSLDILSLIKVATVDGRLERLEVSSHVVPQSAWILGDDAGNVVARANNSKGWKIFAVVVSPERRDLRLNRLD